MTQRRPAAGCQRSDATVPICRQATNDLPPRILSSKRARRLALRLH